MAFEIPVELADGPIMRAFERIKAEARNTGDVIKQSITTAPSSVGSARTGIGSGGSAPSGASMRSFGYHIGNRQRLEEAMNWREKALGSGDSAIIGDAEARVARLKRAVDREERLQNGPTRDQALLDMIMTSRVLPGGQLSPLVNRLVAFKNAAGADASGTLESLGLSEGSVKALAPMIGRLAAVAMPAAVVAAGGATMLMMASAGAAAAERTSRLSRTTPGSPENINRAAALGLDPRDLGERLQGGGLGAAYMRARGIVDIGWRTKDRAENAVRAMEALRKEQNPYLRARVAEELGLSDKLYQVDLSDAEFKRLRDSMPTAPTMAQRRTQASYRANMERVGNYYETYKAKAGYYAMRGVNDLLSGDPKRIGEALSRLTPYGMVYDLFKSRNQRESAEGGRGKDVTNTIENMTRAMKDFTEVIGGGSRARGAIPEGFGAYLKISDQLDNHARVLGAFSVA